MRLLYTKPNHEAYRERLPHQKVFSEVFPSALMSAIDFSKTDRPLQEIVSALQQPLHLNVFIEIVLTDEDTK